MESKTDFSFELHGNIGSDANREEMLTPRMERGQKAASQGEVELVAEDKQADHSPLRSTLWSDLTDDFAGISEEDEAGLDASPKSPSKSARRANRRRRCREAARASAAEAEASPTSGRPLLPAGAFVNVGFQPLHCSPTRTCTPTCISSPMCGGMALLPAAAFANGAQLVGPAPVQAVVGDASTRTPTAACTSPFAMAFGATDASGRGLAPMGTCWGMMSPGGLPMVPMMPSLMGAASPMAASPMAPGPGAFPAPTPNVSPAAYGGPAGSKAEDTLRSFFGQGGALPTGDELAARLRAAAPETYED